MRSIVIISSSLLWSLACSNDAKFRVDLAKKVGAFDAGAAETLNFGLTVQNGDVVTRAQLAAAKPDIKYKIRGIPLNKDELNEWSVSIYPEGGLTAKALAVTPQKVDLSKSNGLTTVKADFAHRISKGKGFASAVIFVDGEAPVVNVARGALSDSGQNMKISWSATDNYKILEDKTHLIACVTETAAFAPKSSSEFAALPSDCVVLFKGADLYAQGSSFVLNEISIGAEKILPRDVHLGLFAEDSVGQGSFVWLKDADEMLSLNAKPQGIVFTNKAKVDASLELLHTAEGVTTQVDDDKNQGFWPDYDLLIAPRVGGSVAETKAFDKRLSLKIGPEEVAYGFDLQATSRSSGISSNKQSISLVYDITPPKISGLTIAIDKLLPSADSHVNLAWAVFEKNKVVSQKIEIRNADDPQWKTVAEVDPALRTFIFPWGDRPLSKTFQIRVSAVDIATNEGSGTNTWNRQIFNAAVLTSNVECFFCHTKIVGDVAGIGFPETVRNDTGRHFEITGKIYGTNTVPAKLAATAKGGSFSNYDNSGDRIFPKDMKFPVLDPVDLKTSVKGSVDTTTVKVTNNHVGNLVLTGTPSNPIVVHGEVFVDGDIIISGKYRGLGTIYAKNIYIVDDLTAVKSPFPFSEKADEASAQALASVIRGDDGLYLGALNQIVVGNAKNRLQTALGIPFLSQTEYDALGRAAVWPQKLDGSNVEFRNPCCSPVGKDDAIFKTEVNQVDAYLYAGKLMTWRSYSNVVLNGGFMSPKGSIVSSVPEKAVGRTDLKPNARTGLPVDQNLVRYDWRLRIGGGGFETLKTKFND